MEPDIVPELLEKIKSDFGKSLGADKKIEKYLKKIRDGTATLEETSLFARRLGEHLSKILQINIIQGDLPDGRMYYNIAERIIRPMLEMNYKLTNEAGAAVQKAMDEMEGIHLRALKGEFPEERVESLIWSISEEGIEWEEVQKRMGEPVCNISQSFMDGFVKANADFRHKAGMRTEIVRKLQGGACKWCKNLAGSYDYSDAPKDVYRRHDNCRCTVTFKWGRMRINVWSKEEWNI